MRTYLCNVPWHILQTKTRESSYHFSPYVDRIIEWLGVKMCILFGNEFGRIKENKQMCLTHSKKKTTEHADEMCFWNYVRIDKKKNETKTNLNCATFLNWKLKWRYLTVNPFPHCHWKHNKLINALVFFSFLFGKVVTKLWNSFGGLFL